MKKAKASAYNPFKKCPECGKAFMYHYGNPYSCLQAKGK